MAKEFRGSYTVSVTPFTEDGSGIDFGALKNFLDWQIEVGVPGIIALGSTGEFLAVSDEERRQLVETYVNHIDGRMPVIIGTMNAHTPNAVRHSRQAEDLGADGVMIIPPYYYTPTDDEIFRYYEAIDAAISIPIMLYNNPVTSNVDMSAKLQAKLCLELESVQYVKESSMHLSRVPEVIEASGGRMKVYAGSGWSTPSCWGRSGTSTRSATTYRGLPAGSSSCSKRAASKTPGPSGARSTGSSTPSPRATRPTVTSATPRRWRLRSVTRWVM